MSLSDITKKIFTLFFHVFTIDAIPSTIVTPWESILLESDIFTSFSIHYLKIFLTLYFNIFFSSSLFFLLWNQELQHFRTAMVKIDADLSINSLARIYIHIYIFYILLYMYTYISDIFLICLKHRISFKGTLMQIWKSPYMF